MVAVQRRLRRQICKLGHTVETVCIADKILPRSCNNFFHLAREIRRLYTIAHHRANRYAVFPLAPCRVSFVLNDLCDDVQVLLLLSPRIAQRHDRLAVLRVAVAPQDIRRCVQGLLPLRPYRIAFVSLRRCQQDHQHHQQQHADADQRPAQLVSMFHTSSLNSRQKNTSSSM